MASAALAAARGGAGGLGAGKAGGDVGQRKKCYFLKKRTKKLLLFGVRGPCRHAPREPTSKGFLVPFFKK
jgi:hypothetical protein